MERLTKITEDIMKERFGKDNVIALATSSGNMPYVRYVNAYYEGSAFYIITYGLSNKMQQILQNPKVSIAGDWFTAQGTGRNLGYFGKLENAEIAKKLQGAFAEWIDNGHNNFADKNTCILKVELTEGVLFSQGKRYHIDFMKGEANGED